MDFKKLSLVAAAGALTVASAVPAMAFENEFHGMFRLRAFVSNFDGRSNSLTALPATSDELAGAGATAAQKAAMPGVPLSEKSQAAHYVEQRARIQYTAKASDDLKLVTHFEIDSRWGDAAYDTGRNKGGAVGADTTNIETKDVYLDFNIPTATKINVKAGIQPFTDAFKGIVFNNDAAGGLLSAKYGNAQVGTGFFRFNDTGYNAKTRDFIVLDGKYSVSKDLKVGGAYYGILDGRGAGQPGNYPFAGYGQIHTFGVNAEANVGPATVDGFVAFQAGKLGGLDLSAYAANLGAKAKLGPGTARAQLLYTSGGMSGEKVTAWQGVYTNGPTGAFSSENSFYPSNMYILMRHPQATNTDTALVSSSTNYGGGIMAAFVGYDLPLSDKLFVNSNAGFIGFSKIEGVYDNADSKYIGTEINTSVGYKLYPNLTAEFQAAYVFLGDALKDINLTDYEDPYTTRIVLSYVF